MDAPSCQGIHLTPHRYLMLQRSPRSHVEGGERRCALGVGFVDGTLAFVVNTIVFDAVSTQNIYVSAGCDSKGKVGGSVLDAGERLVDGKCARQMFGSLFLQIVGPHTVKGKRHQR